MEISGVVGEPVQVELVDLQGRLLHGQRIVQASAVERVAVPVGDGPGLQLLQVSTPAQRQLIRLLRQ